LRDVARQVCSRLLALCGEFGSELVQRAALLGGELFQAAAAFRVVAQLLPAPR
jgi:hypothetical protein